MTDPILIDGLLGDPSSVLIEGELIAALGDGGRAAAGSTRRLAGSGLRAVPGFIELQVNGLGGADVTSRPESLWELAGLLPRHGVTAFLPTVVSSPRGTVERVLEALAGGHPAEDAAVPLGVHVEGPFLAESRRGAHEAAHLRDPDLGEIARWVEGGARLLTLAPERPRALEAIARIVAGGAVAAVGHTDADAATVARAVDAGARYATHLFNAMPRLHHRAPGAAGALLDDGRVTIGLVGDGIHVDPLVLRLAARVAPGRISLVSDAVAGRLGEATVAPDESGAVRLADGTLAGGHFGLDHVVRTFAAAVGSMDRAVDAVTAVPGRLLGLHDGRGELRPGGRADLVLLDDGGAVAATIIGGRPAYLVRGVAWP
ncbi:MAG TPA: amidohydrolase family protein [Candidatus Angelobacter sp.]|nr:amidohydrolase family protein [Candidatus Angelobacter sp.]